MLELLDKLQGNNFFLIKSWSVKLHEVYQRFVFVKKSLFTGDKSLLKLVGDDMVCDERM